MQQGREQADLVDGAGGAARFDVVADLERPEDDDHHAGGEIAQRILEREADGEAGGAEDGHQRDDVDAQRIYRRQRHRDEQDRVADIADESDQHFIGAAAAHGFLDQVADHAREDLTDDENRDRDGDLNTPVDRILIDPGCDVFHGFSFGIEMSAD